MGRFNGENISGKVLAVVLAIILWVYVMNEQNPPVEQTITIKLEVRGVTQGLYVTDSPESVKIRFRGPRSIIAGLREQDLGAYVDVRTLGEGEHAVPVKTVTPVSLEILEVVPKVVNVRLENQISRQLPVSPRFTGAPAIGVVVNKATIKPNVVTVTGPKSLIDSIDTIAVAINMDGRDKDVVVEGTPRAYMNNGGVLDQISVAPEKVQVEMSIQKNAVKRVEIKPVVFGEPAAGAVISRIIAEPGQVEIQGQTEALRTTDWLYTMPIEVTGQAKDIVRDVKLQPREGIVAPDTVKVTIQIAVAKKETQ